MKRTQHRYSSDKPITRLPEDQFGRSGFAKRLANDIGAWKGGESLVVALYGDWGSGKTSLKNLALASLAKRRKKIPTVEFNPWQLSGTGGIASAFFEELRIALHPTAGDTSEATADRARRLNAYAKRLSLGSWVANAVGGLFAASGHLDAEVSAAAIGASLGQAADVSKAGCEAAEANAASEDLPLNILKNSLADSLRQLQRPLLIVIDDIDRLTTREILDVFQLVKANADFPNVIYLLLFERSIVCKALDQVSDNRGSEFLEKIVQVGYHVPHASGGAVQKVLFRGLDEDLALPGVNRRWSTERWTDLYLEGLSPFFRNLRHVYRFLSSFDFHVRQFQSGNRFEVNPVDLVGLETLRVFEPTVFERLALAKRILRKR
jgi:predicted KAP-like P-loop ATPase